MEDTLLRVLGLFSLNLLFNCGRAQGPNAVLTVEPHWPLYFPGELVTLTCDMNELEDTDWWYAFNRNDRYITNFISEKNYGVGAGSGELFCVGQYKYNQYGNKKSNKVNLNVSDNRPKAIISEATTGGAVTLNCSVRPLSNGWKYYWYRGKKNSETLTAEDTVFLSKDRIRVSQEGLYWCRGGRGNPVYYTEYSDPTVTCVKPDVKLEHKWAEIFYGERIRLTCEIEDGGDIEWEFEWMKQTVNLSKREKVYEIYATTLESGDYMCRGRSPYGPTQWSNAFTVTTTDKPKLSVSSLWPSPGASVTLNCSATHLSAGWRFYWYKVIPDRRKNPYSYELLPESANGTTEDSYVVHNHTNTAGYACKAIIRDPERSTTFSSPTFVWSREIQSEPSLRVSPNRVQHFRSNSVSLTCEGSSTVTRFRDGYLERCSWFGRENGSTCITKLRDHAVYWCESESGQFSSAVNITASADGIILESPTYPVPEGTSVTLRCKLKADNFVGPVLFYQNDQLVQNNTKWELVISALSQSHEGFYRCEGETHVRPRTSPQSWVSVKSRSNSESSPRSSHLPLIFGLVCIVFIIILLLLLLLLLRSRRSKAQGNQSSEYASPIHGDVCHYETVKLGEDTGNDEPRDVVYSLIGIKPHEINGEKSEPDISCVYSDLEIRSDTDDGLMYAKVQSRRKGKSAPIVSSETIYSAIKPGS